MTDTGSHYRHEITFNLTDLDCSMGWVTIQLDPARIAELYKITNHMQFFVIKKGLKAGARGHKDIKRDIADIRNACDRWEQMLDEDSERQFVINHT